MTTASPPIRGLLVNIDVDDLAAGTRFYTEALGLTVGRRFGGLAVELNGASSPVYLLAKAPGTPAASGVGAARSYRRHWTPVHLDLVVDDVEDAVSRAVSAGARLEDAPATHAWGRIAQLADPFGHGFCLLEFRGRGYDEIADPQASGPPADGRGRRCRTGLQPGSRRISRSVRPS